MTRGLDVVILDDEPPVLKMLSMMLAKFYKWGNIHSFTDYEEAKSFCLKRPKTVTIFIIDVFLGNFSAFDFIEAMKPHYPMASDDTIVITGFASDDVVDQCMSSRVYYLLEKPIRFHALQLTVRAIASKYFWFAPKIMGDAEFAEGLKHIELDPDYKK